MTEHTPTPWVYRPNNHDDWGWIRDADGNLAATARDGRVWSDQFDAYRAAGTDPYEPNATFIIKAVNNHDALVEAVETACEYLESEDGFRPAVRLREKFLALLSVVGAPSKP